MWFIVRCHIHPWYLKCQWLYVKGLKQIQNQSIAILLQSIVPVFTCKESHIIICTNAKFDMCRWRCTCSSIIFIQMEFRTLTLAFKNDHNAYVVSPLHVPVRGSINVINFRWFYESQVFRSCHPAMEHVQPLLRSIMPVHHDCPSPRWLGYDLVWVGVTPFVCGPVSNHHAQDYGWHLLYPHFSAWRTGDLPLSLRNCEVMW